VGGSTKFNDNAEGEYEPLTGTTTGGYATTAATPTPANYTLGNLFPFTNPWSVYAGDCKENNPAKYSNNKIAAGSAVVEPGKAVPVNVPMSHVTLNVYKTGTIKETTQREVKITNLSCTKSTEQIAENATKANFEHRQMTSTEGHLEYPYQPFGEFEICLAYNKGTTTHRVYKIISPYENTTEEGLTLPSILTEGVTSGWTKTEPPSEAKC
jgi:hypothetical protein